MDFQHICVVGLGYIGLPTASVLAVQGLRVTGVDVNHYVVETINRSEIHITERDLDVLVRSAVQSGNLKASLTPCAADVYIIAVPTPFKDEKKPDLTFIKQATQSITPYLKPGNLIILESTSPVGTTECIAKWLHEARSDLNIPGFAQVNTDKQIYLAHCPERVLPGQILRELVENDRIVGGIDEDSALQAKALYEVFSQGNIVLTNARLAEMSKLTENAFRDVNIAFANELANICDYLDINVWELIRLANHHPRVNILQPGPGVGGHCIAVDPWFIVDSAPAEAKLIRTAREVNDARPAKVLAKISQALVEQPDAVIACLGLSFKANIDDLRESPAMKIVEWLAHTVPNKILVVEPHIKELPGAFKKYKNVVLVSFAEALEQAGLVVLLVGHDKFNNSPLALKNKMVIDTRGIWEHISIQSASRDVIQKPLSYARVREDSGAHLKLGEIEIG